MRSRSLPFLITSDNQFSFKRNVGTETCVFLLKEIIRSYIDNATPVYCAFLDASKAFDRVNHYKLLTMLHDRGLPHYLISIIANWYQSSRLFVRWGESLSDGFSSSNGVRQGSLLSPLLFAVYVDGLSGLLNKLKVGCFSGFQLINHLFYADDFVLISPSIAGLRRLLLICESFAIKNDIIFNEGKSVLMRFSKTNLSFDPGSVSLNNTPLIWQERVKYLGVILTCNLCDRIEIESLLRNFYAKANTICRVYRHCSLGIKLSLFDIFCMNFYLIYLCFNYPICAFNRLKVATNIMLRKFVGLPRFCSASEMHVFFAN